MLVQYFSSQPQQFLDVDSSLKLTSVKYNFYLNLIFFLMKTTSFIENKNERKSEFDIKNKMEIKKIWER